MPIFFHQVRMLFSPQRSGCRGRFPTDTHALFRGDVVDAVRNGLAVSHGGEVVRICEDRNLCRLPLLSLVVERANQLLLLRVDGDDRLSLGLETPSPSS